MESKYEQHSKYLSSLTSDQRYQLRINIYNQTVNCVNQGLYLDESGNEVMIRSSSMNSLKYLNEPDVPASQHSHEVFIFNGDCLDAAIKLKESFNPAVLNMANNFTPGGGVSYGAGAQEESIFRRSDYFLHLPQALYPIDGVIYSPAVQVFRASESESYQFLSSPISISMVACSALRRPELVSTDHGLDYNEDDKKTMIRKIRLVLAAAAFHGNDAIVLGALGCGAFRNPTPRVAELFSQVIHESFGGCFKKIVFAIFNDHNSFKENSTEGNLVPFEKVFGKTAVIDVAELAK